MMRTPRPRPVHKPKERPVPLTPLSDQRQVRLPAFADQNPLSLEALEQLRVMKDDPNVKSHAGADLPEVGEEELRARLSKVGGHLGGWSDPLVATIKSIPDLSTTVEVQKEHVALLRELLQGKNNWLEEQLKTERERYKQLWDAHVKLQADREELRIGLAEAISAYTAGGELDNEDTQRLWALTRVR